MIRNSRYFLPIALFLATLCGPSVSTAQQPFDRLIPPADYDIIHQVEDPKLPLPCEDALYVIQPKGEPPIQVDPRYDESWTPSLEHPGQWRNCIWLRAFCQGHTGPPHYFPTQPYYDTRRVCFDVQAN